MAIVLNIFRQMIKENKYLFIHKRGQKRIQDLEGIFTAILYKVKYGCQWWLLPVELFVNCSQITVYYYFVSWVNNGFFKDLWINTIKVYRKIHKIRFYRQSIDSTKIKCIKGGDNTGKNPTDRSRKGSSIHTLIDQRGIPLSAIITGANIADSSQVENLINNMVIKTPSCEKPTLIHTMKKTHSVFIELRSKGAKRVAFWKNLQCKFFRALLKKGFRNVDFVKNRIFLCKRSAPFCH